MMRLLLILCGVGLVISLLVRGATTLADHAAASPRPGAASAVSGSTTMVSAASRSGGGQSGGIDGETVITRDSSGQFYLYLSVNGQRLPFLVDTGADKVTLTIDAARAIGLYVDPTGFTPVAMGAGGPVTGQRIVIDRLEVGGRTLTGVDGLVLDGLGTNLLGQSALAQLGAVEMRGDQMILR